MPIPVSCGCGRALRIKDELAGRKIRCPTCNAVLTVPAPETELEVVEEEENEGYELLDENATQKRPRAANESEEEYSRRERRRLAEEKDRREQRREDEREEKRRRKQERQEDVRRQERLHRPCVVDDGGRHFGTSEAGVIGGIVMILIAVVWFVLGLMAGRVFFYPPILAVLGIAAIVKGLTRH
jgi:hypothetical protein